MGFPIRRSRDQRVFAPPPSFSQRITSFIACACQGIHQLPLLYLITLIAHARRDPLRDRRQRQTPAQLQRSCRHPVQRPPTPRERRTRQRHISKRPASRDRSGGAVRQPIIGGGLSVTPRQTNPHNPSQGGANRSPNPSSLHNVKQNRQPAQSQAANLIPCE